MKVILNKDVSPLGEEGDVREVAKGYARNFLFPRNLAVPYTDKTVKLFESRKAEIEAHKAEKRSDAASLKAKYEAIELLIVMPAGANGKLYGAVTSQTVADEFAKLGFHIDRKRIELAGTHFKSVGKYKVNIKLYENTVAEVVVVVQAAVKVEDKTAHKPAPRRFGRPMEAPPAPEATPVAEAAPVAEGTSTAGDEAVTE